MKKINVEKKSVNVKDLWGEFGDIPMNPVTEEIEVDWNRFKAGTHREEIWHWFEETFGVSVAQLMYGNFEFGEVEK